MVADDFYAFRQKQKDWESCDEAFQRRVKPLAHALAMKANEFERTLPLNSRFEVFHNFQRHAIQMGEVTCIFPDTKQVRFYYKEVDYYDGKTTSFHTDVPLEWLLDPDEAWIDWQNHYREHLDALEKERTKKAQEDVARAIQAEADERALYQRLREKFGNG